MTSKLPPYVSVITPASRGVEHLKHLLRDFYNQTFKSFEHIIVYDGDPPKDVVDFVENAEKKHQSTIFTNVDKDLGDMTVSPGTKPRNFGTSIARGYLVVYADDDDRYKDTYLEKLAVNLQENEIHVVQMSCSEARMVRNGDPEKTRLVPEIGLPTFPIPCHVGTPCFIVKREWALAEPWRSEMDHDFQFISRICQRFKPRISVIGGMQIDVDGRVTKGIQDWVSIPPFYRK